MKFNIIDRENWERKEYFDHFISQQCTFSITTNINITALLTQLQNKGFKLYPAFIYMVTRTVNSHKEFRFSFNEEGILGYWNEMIPSYTIFHQDSKTFSSIWTVFSNEFSAFYKSCQEDIQQYTKVKKLESKDNVPTNNFNISSIPWVSFTGFNLNMNNDNDYLLPIITGGKYFHQNGQTLLPITLQIHHAVCDGYHASLFFEELQKLANNCHDWLP
ncbi:MAG: type A chloramphenicol O-acetyltransferase [Psychrobacillus sp.]